MGQHFQFRCEHCSYEAVVSGGPDLGMMSRTQTITCAKCKELADVVTSEEPWNSRAPKLPPRCPRRRTAKHPVKRWTAGGPCPRCGAALQKGELVALWD